MSRWFVTLLVIATVVAPQSARADEPGGRCVLASKSASSEAAAAAAVDGLGPGTRLIRLKDVNPKKLREQCRTVTVAVGRKALKTAVAHLKDAPIIFTMVTSPDSITAGRTNVRGVAMDADPKRVLETLKSIKPGLKRVGVVYDPKRTQALVDAGRKSASALGLELVAVQVHDVGEALKAFHQFKSKKKDVDALWLLPDSTATSRESVYYALELAQWKGIPVVGLSKWYVANGALFALAPRAESMGKRAGELARAVAQGETVDKLDFGGDHNLLLNQRTATRLRLELSPQILKSAAEVME